MVDDVTGEMKTKGNRYAPPLRFKMQVEEGHLPQPVTALMLQIAAINRFEHKEEELKNTV